MIRLFYLLFLAFAASIAAASSATKDDRIIGFVTQDTNGIHFVTIVAKLSAASVRSGAPGTPHEPHDVPYPTARFDSVWQAIQNDGFARFETHGEQHLHVESNFAVMISAAGIEHSFLIPKCSAPSDVTGVIEAMTQGLLPDGSPGLFKPCVEAPSDPAKPSGLSLAH